MARVGASACQHTRLRHQVVTRVFGYKRLNNRTHAVVGSEDLDLPTLEFTSFACWVDFPMALKEAVEAAGGDMLGGAHAAAHAVRAASATKVHIPWFTTPFPRARAPDHGRRPNVGRL